MNSVIDVVQKNIRMRRFAATYALMYLVISLLLNYLGGALSLLKPPLSYVFELVCMLIQAPFIYGFVRGLLLKDYNVSNGLRAYVELKNYPIYFAYICLNVIHSILESLFGMLSSSGGAGAVFGNVGSVILIIIRILLNFYLIKLYFDRISSEENGGKTSLIRTFNGCIKVLKKRPGKIIAAEIFMMVANFVSVYLAAMIMSFLPSNEIIKLVFTCLTTIQFGVIIWTWPIYYLYYEYICDAVE